MTGASTISKNRCHGSRPPYQVRLDQAAAFTALVSAAGVDDSDLPFFAEDLFPLAGAGRAFAGLAFDCAFLAAVFGFWAFTFAFLSLVQRAFAAALIFALASAESLRRFRGAAVSAARPADR